MYKGCEQTQKDVGAHLKPQNPWTTMGKKSRVCDCYGVLEKVAWIWRLLGIFPFTIKGPMMMKKYKINKFYAVYSVSIFFTCFINLVYGIMHYKDYLSSEDIARAYSSIMIRSIASMMCMVISIMIRIYRNKELPELIETMTVHEAFLEKIGCQLNYGGNVKMLQIYLWTSAITAGLLMAYDCYVSTPVFDSFTLRWLVWIIPLIAQILDLTIFVTLIGLLGLQFRALNEKIKTVIIRVNASSPKIIVTSKFCAEKLRLVAKAHYINCAIGKRIDRFFNWDVIINVITAVIIVSTTLHSSFIEFQRKSNANYIRIGLSVPWELIHSVPIIIIVVICNWTSHQAIYAGRLIHEIRTEKTDSGLYEAVKLFSLQLHHQKLEFTTGFVPLNSTLLQTMVANISTYLVILIQFQPKSWDEDIDYRAMKN